MSNSLPIRRPPRPTSWGPQESAGRGKGGDVLVFTNSSHGTYVADTTGDEEKYDEAICPYDCADNLIVDDDLRELFANLARGSV